MKSFIPLKGKSSLLKNLWGKVLENQVLLWEISNQD